MKKDLVLDVFRSADFIPAVVEELRRARQTDPAARLERARRLHAWMNTWRGTQLEKEWLHALVSLASELMTADGAEWPAPETVEKIRRQHAGWPEAGAYAKLLLEDALAPESRRRVRVPVVFVSGNKQSGPPIVATLELRLARIAGETGTFVHPADRWRRKLRSPTAPPPPGSPPPAAFGPAHVDFVDSIGHAVALARQQLHGAGSPLQAGAVLWRLLDFPVPDEKDTPCPLGVELEGCSAGGAAARAAAHLLGPSTAVLPPRIFVLAEVEVEGGRPTGQLKKVGGVEAKIVALARSVDGPDVDHRYFVYVVTAEKPKSPEIASDIEDEELHPTPVTAFSDLLKIDFPFAPKADRLKTHGVAKVVTKMTAAVLQQEAENKRRIRRLYYLFVGSVAVVLVVSIFFTQPKFTAGRSIEPAKANPSATSGKSSGAPVVPSSPIENKAAPDPMVVQKPAESRLLSKVEQSAPAAEKPARVKEPMVVPPPIQTVAQINPSAIEDRIRYLTNDAARKTKELAKKQGEMQILDDAIKQELIYLQGFAVPNGDSSRRMMERTTKKSSLQQDIISLEKEIQELNAEIAAEKARLK